MPKINLQSPDSCSMTIQTHTELEALLAELPDLGVGELLPGCTTKMSVSGEVTKNSGQQS